MRREIGAHRLAAFLPDILGPLLGIEPRDLAGQHLYFLGPEQAWKEEKPVVFKNLDLFTAEFHSEDPHPGLRPRRVGRRTTAGSSDGPDYRPEASRTE